MYTSTKSSNKTENWFSPPRGRIIYGPALAEAPKQKAHETRLKMPFDKLIFRQERSFVIIHTHAKRSGPISKLRAVFIKKKKMQPGLVMHHLRLLEEPQPVHVGLKVDFLIRGFFPTSMSD